MLNQEDSLQVIEAAIIERSNKLSVAQICSLWANTSERKNYYLHRAELFEGELIILREGHARLMKEYLTQLN